MNGPIEFRYLIDAL